MVLPAADIKLGRLGKPYVEAALVQNHADGLDFSFFLLDWSLSRKGRKQLTSEEGH